MLGGQAPGHAYPPGIFSVANEKQMDCSSLCCLPNFLVVDASVLCAVDHVGSDKAQV